MLKHLLNIRIVFVVILLIVSSQIFAQDTARVKWNQQVKAALNMQENQYSQYIMVKEKYDKQIKKIMRDSSLDKSSKIVEVEKVLTERREVVKHILTGEQVKKLAVLEKQRAIAKGSKYYKQQQELESRMMKRKLDRARADSARLKTVGQ